jgi:RNA polymerase sigma-70 factor, ECF subfamily
MTHDGDLWERIRQGDARVFEDFYQQNAPKLKGFLRQLLGHTQTAEDVTQEAFLQLWRRPNGFHPEDGSLRAYLFGIGRKCAAEWWRQRKAEMQEPVAPSERALHETASLVDDAFSRLDAEQRSLLWLREVEGQSYEELAHILGIPLGTVRSRLFTAREKLRSIWRGERQPRKEIA